MKKKFIIVTTVPLSLYFFKGQIQILKKKFEIELVSSPGIMFDDNCKSEKVQGHAIEMRREISLLNDIRSLLSLSKLFFKEKPEIVHGSTPKAGLLSMIAAWLTKVPTRIYYLHGLRYQGATGLKRKLLVNMERLSCYLSTQVYAVSFGVKKVLEDEKITNKRIKMIGKGSVNGINANYFSPKNLDIPDLKPSLNLAPENFIFGFIGRLVQDKGINELVKAFLQINKLRPESKLLLVGEVENSNPIEKNIELEIKTNANILNVGFQKDVRPYYKIMDVFVFPSYREGFGVALMEASAMNVPSIATDIIGCNEIIAKGINGMLIQPKSEEELFDAMKVFISDEEKRAVMAMASRNYVIEKYEQNNLWHKTLESYCSISEYKEN